MIEEVLEAVLFDVEAGVRYVRTVRSGQAVKQSLRGIPKVPPLRARLDQRSASGTHGSQVD